MKHGVSYLYTCVQGGYRAPASANPTAPPMPSAPGIPDYSANKAGIPNNELSGPKNACIVISVQKLSRFAVLSLTAAALDTSCECSVSIV